MPHLRARRPRLAYEVYGEGSRNVVLLPGLLLPEPHARAARARPRRSRQPRDHARPARARRVGQAARHVALLDADLRAARSSRCSTTSSSTRPWSAAPRWAPTRRSRSPRWRPRALRGMVIEMPVLDNALLGCAIAFTPLLVALTFGAPITAAGGRAACAACRACSATTRTSSSTCSAATRGPSSAVLQGLFFGRTAPPREERKTFEAPAIVLGPPARRDPPVLRRQDACRGAAQRPPDRGQLALRAALAPAAADRARSPRSSTSAGSRAARAAQRRRAPRRLAPLADRGSRCGRDRAAAPRGRRARPTGARRRCSRSTSSRSRCRPSGSGRSARAARGRTRSARRAACSPRSSRGSTPPRPSSSR